MTITDRITITSASSSGAHTSGDNLQHDAPATRPMSTVSAQRLAAAIVGSPGDGEAGALPSTDPYLATDEPGIAEAANLLSRILASGAVARLDLLHDALTAAHRRGRAAERAEVQRLAHEHAGAFVAAVVARTDAEFRRDARAWCEQ